MIKLADALSNRFPQGNEWATQALGALAGEFDPSTLVHELSEGWMRRGSGPDAELVDTLFILTSDRLGLGQTTTGSGDPRWIPLSSVVAIDAVDDSPLPLQTIEIEMAGGVAMCVGWPEAFSARLVDVLVALAEGVSMDEAEAESMPAELADPSTLVDDVSGLDSISPSGWVEPDVAETVEPEPEPVPEPGPVAVDVDVDVEATGHVEDQADAGLDDLPAPVGPRPVVAALDFFNPTPDPEPAPRPDSPWLDTDDDVDHRPVDSAAFEPVTFDSAAFDSAPFEPGEAFSPADAHRPSAFAEAERFDPAAFEEWIEPLAPAPTVDPEPAGPPPWNLPGMVWPDPLRGVQYLGGHPGHSRKRKNGTMVFSPHGLEVAGSGFQSWDMSIDWAFVEGVEIQGPDEVLFGDNVKIDSTSSALVVTMTDETRMFFEVRTRRPPSLRAALAPVLLMVENIRSHRAHS